VFVCLCVCVDMCLYVVEPRGFRVLRPERPEWPEWHWDEHDADGLGLGHPDADDFDVHY
jgi:hypothetical protein